MKTALVFCCLFASVLSFGQFPDTGACVKRPPIDLTISIRGFANSKMVHIDTTTLSKGFELVTLDKSVEIIGFRVYFYGKYMDLYWRDIVGSKANRQNLPVLKNLHGDELMELECIAVKKGNGIFRATKFTVLIDAK